MKHPQHFRDSTTGHHARSEDQGKDCFSLRDMPLSIVHNRDVLASVDHYIVQHNRSDTTTHEGEREAVLGMLIVRSVSHASCSSATVHSSAAMGMQSVESLRLDNLGVMVQSDPLRDGGVGASHRNAVLP